jgi:hypothetical protein
MLVLDAVDDVAEVVSDGTQRLDTHGHNCGSPDESRFKRGSRLPIGLA